MIRSVLLAGHVGSAVVAMLTRANPGMNSSYKELENGYDVNMPLLSNVELKPVGTHTTNVTQDTESLAQDTECEFGPTADTSQKGFQYNHYPGTQLNPEFPDEVDPQRASFNCDLSDESDTVEESDVEGVGTVEAKPKPLAAIEQKYFHALAQILIEMDGEIDNAEDVKAATAKFRQTNPELYKDYRATQKMATSWWESDFMTQLARAFASGCVVAGRHY